MTLSEQVDELRRWLKKAMRRIKTLEAQVSDITQAEKDVETSEAALETRVTAHEQNLKDISGQLQTQIDALNQKLGASDSATQALVALKAKIDGFDADAAPATGDTSGASAGSTAGSTAGTDTGAATGTPVDNGTPA